MGSSRLVVRGAATACAALGLAACSVLNDVDACQVEPREVRVNQRADLNELLGHANAAVRLHDGRLLVAYSAADEEVTTGEVRIVMLSPTDGTRIALCSTGDLEWVMNEPGTLAYAATAAATELDADGTVAAAAIGWIEGQGSSTQARVRFVDGAGCPIGQGPFSPAFAVETITTGLSLAWSPTRQAILAVYHDERSVFTSWIDSTGPAAALPIATEAWIGGGTALAMAPDGRALVAWVAADSVAALSERRLSIRAALLDVDGSVRPAALAAGEARPFDIELPAKFSPSGTSLDIVLAASAGRYAIAADPAISASARPSVFVVQLDGETGAMIGSAERADPHTGEGHGNPGLSYLPADSLLVAWESTLSGGTLARLFDAELTPRFTSVGCDEERFAVGERTRENSRGHPSILVDDEQVWVVHAAQPEYDAVGSGVVAWTLPFSKLWPASR